VGNTYALSINIPRRQKNSYEFQGHQLKQGSLGKFEADKASMLRVNFGNQESAAKFSDTFSKMAGSIRVKKAYGHDSSVTQLQGIIPQINLQIDEDAPSVNHCQEDMKSPLTSPEIYNNRVCTQFISPDKFRRQSELPCITINRHRRSSETNYTASGRHLMSSNRRSSMDVFGSLSRAPATATTWTSASLLDPIPQSPSTDEYSESDKSRSRGFAYALTDLSEKIKYLRITSKKQKDNNSNRKIGD